MTPPVLGRRGALRVVAASLFTVVLSTGTACSRSDGPLDPVWGKEPCAHCKMLVSDRVHAAQVSLGGERLYFDDIGCMALWLDVQEKRASEPVRAWVRDAAGPGWLEARSARYASGARTPMDFGFEARSGGEGVDFEAMREAALARKRSTR